MLELAAILILGIAAQWVAWKIKLPAIFPLIVIGLLAGPFSAHFLGDKLIDPTRIFEGKMLNYFVSLSVGVILFEGGLTLRFKDVRHVASTVRNLIVIGPIVTLIGGALAAHYIMGLEIRVAMLFGSLIIVTGPTVIGPILRNVLPARNVATVLRWESILIDPIGALVAVLMYEFILSGGMGTQFTLTALGTFGITIFAGVLMGGFCAWFLYYFLRRNWVPGYLLNVFSLAVVFLAFTGADMIAHESGLLAVTLMGMILANMRLPELTEIFNFKENLTVLLISILFIILSANIGMEELQLLGWDSVIIFTIVVLVLRPLTVFLSSIRSNLNLREKIYISWIGPRGIVAAAIASIFAISIMENPNLSNEVKSDAELLIPLTFLIILGTVVFQGISAKPVAKALKVIEKDSSGYMILGAHEGGRAIAKYLQSIGVHVVLVDTSHTNVNEAKMMNLKVVERNILSDDLSDKIEFTDIGNFLALTSNNELNIFSCRKFRKDFERNTAYRLITRNEMKFTSLVRPKDILFGTNVDFYKLINLARKYPMVHEVKIEDEEDLDRLMNETPENIVPLFIRHTDDSLQVVLTDHSYEYREGCVLAFLGELMESETETEEVPA